MAAQLVKKVVYVDMKALEEGAAVSCWRPVGARTDRKLGLIRECAWRLVALATLTLLDLNAQRTMDTNEGKKKGISISTLRTRTPQPPHATTFCLHSSISRSHSHTRGGQRASERDRTAAAARENEEFRRVRAPLWRPRTPFTRQSGGPAGRRSSG